LVQYLSHENIEHGTTRRSRDAKNAKVSSLFIFRDRRSFSYKSENSLQPHQQCIFGCTLFLIAVVIAKQQF
jgi:hypothetical protein